jgi:threonine/homoserine/homoserine lactone efflux protein
MDYAALVPFFLASTIFLVAPGPLMAVLIARSLGRDVQGAAAFATGLCVGTLLIVSAIALGVGIWAEGNPELLSLVKYVGVAYLLWLAVGMWKDRSGITAKAGQKQSWLGSTCAGIALSIGSPSVLLFYMLTLPSVAPAGMNGFVEMVPVVLVTFASAVVVFQGTVVLARQLNRIMTSPAATGMFSRIGAVATAMTSVWILAA